ncbi:MAG: class I SAM-dependent methyltransferase [Betaproteobacteria bacterium]|nr:class I SAM-dependent methyltransferase [Betaproteobacteria bacterium]
MVTRIGRVFARAAAALLLCLGAAGVPAAMPDIPVPYIPSTEVAVEEMLRLAGVGRNDMVIDLGSGDGRIVIAAARYFGARGLGVEIDPELVVVASENARKAGVADRVRFVAQDALKADIAQATVVTMYLLSPLIERLKPKLLAELKPGTRIVAHDFGFEGWQPDRKVTISKTVMLYVVPARVSGRWRLIAELPDGRRSFEFELIQQYQRIDGGARVPGGYLPLFEARLEGDRVRFVIVDNGRSHHFEGRVDGVVMTGIVRSGIGTAQTENAWRAERIAHAGRADR